MHLVANSPTRLTTRIARTDISPEVAAQKGQGQRTLVRIHLTLQAEFVTSNL